MAFALRELGPLDYWERQSLRELRDWLQVIEEQKQ